MRKVTLFSQPLVRWETGKTAGLILAQWSKKFYFILMCNYIEYNLILWSYPDLDKSFSMDYILR